MKEELIMKFISFNVNGLRAILKKDFEKTFDDLNADIFSLNETKLSDDAFPFQKEGYEIFYTNSKVKKGYSGVAVFSKIRACPNAACCSFACSSDFDGYRLLDRPERMGCQ